VTRAKPYDWQLAEHCELIQSGGLAFVRARLAWFRSFCRALRNVGWHVSIGSPPECATCGTPWPCPHARQ
jgi:hypothetical protein